METKLREHRMLFLLSSLEMCVSIYIYLHPLKTRIEKKKQKKNFCTVWTHEQLLVQLETFSSMSPNLADFLCRDAKR